MSYRNVWNTLYEPSLVPQIDTVGKQHRIVFPDQKPCESPSSAFTEQIWPPFKQDEGTPNSESPSGPFHAHQYKHMYTFPPECPCFGRRKQSIVVTLLSSHKALFLSDFPNW